MGPLALELKDSRTEVRDQRDQAMLNEYGTVPLDGLGCVKLLQLGGLERARQISGYSDIDIKSKSVSHSYAEIASA